jgi:hypothetical protein
MSTNKRITDLTDYTSILPYASEMFGVYQPMIGWKSKRITKRLNQGLIDIKNSLLQAYAKNFNGISETNFIQCDARITMQVGTLQPIKLLKNSNSALLRAITLPKDKVPVEQEWREFINKNNLEGILNSVVSDFYRNLYHDQCIQIPPLPVVRGPLPIEIEARSMIERNLESNIIRLLNQESALAGALLEMLDQKMYSQLEAIFYEKPTDNLVLVNQQIAEMLNADDPFATFDPKKDIKNVSLSPLGIVHLFRQYFFELDTFLGTPTGHIWLSPGSTVELVEVSTRRVFTEKTFEQSTENITKTENSFTDKDEFSLAIKSDNKKDLKLGASLTVNQSWGTGNATATGSLNIDTTQNTAREETRKRMREQSVKLSSEIRENFKSTFKTITETTDTSSKRYVLSNSTPDLINYELRRKMRQVGVQVQDIGTYLCWETFVDEPGNQLGLANLVHIAKPIDLVSVPEPTKIPYPDDKPMAFTAKVSYNRNKPGRNGPEGFLPLETRTFGLELPDIPDGYRVLPDTINFKQMSATGYQFQYIEFAWRGKIVGKEITFGVYIDGEYDWDNQIDFVVGVNLQLTASSEKRVEIDKANAAKIVAKDAATEANTRKTKEEFIKVAKERIELASRIKTRKYEDLREEERIIVYRNLIGALMSDTFYGMPESNANDETRKANDETRHILSELINSIFDIDKMLYFVAPEWWKPRYHSHQTLGDGNAYDMFTGNLTSWSDLEIRPDNYFITEKSDYAKMGSSLGWLLQLDGDDMRNAFLNAPWVKAVIPIRPGKELEASNWLQQVGVEGTDGLGNLYQAQEDELNKIRATLNIAEVTIGDAIKYLCAEVAAKHNDSLKVGRYPKEEINDDNRVSATPINKVYEHGFYPLKDGFRAVTSEDERYEVFDQWVEVLPTDQVVPVEVKYDPKTGRQI